MRRQSMDRIWGRVEYAYGRSQIDAIMDLDRWMLIGAASAAPGEISVLALSGSAATAHRAVL
jgi:hypothetical protein